MKLCDFGLVSTTVCPVAPHRKAGTQGYAAPEVHQGRLTDWTDQYALAVSYCELRTGRLPFPPPPAGFSASYSRPEPDLSLLIAGEAAVIGRALSRVAPDRWPSCAELMDHLTRQAPNQPPAPAPAPAAL